MIRAFHTSATGMNAQQVVLDNTANNLANLNTNGFKRSMIDFQDLAYTTLRQPGAESTSGQQLPTGLQIGHGVRVAGNSHNFAPGTLQNTGNPLDMAIDGNGFIKVSGPSGGFRYTRDGSLHTNSTGQLVTVDGYLVQPQITIPPNTLSVSVGTDGTISVVNGSTPNVSTNVGNLTLTSFPNAGGLSSEGRNLFSETAASGAPTDAAPGSTGLGLLRGGFIEGSNVDVVTEMVNLIQAQRAYEFNTKAITVADEMLSDTNNLVR